MIAISDKSRCCGCTACQSVCPHGAVLMKADAMGFVYPQVDMEVCTGCGLCESVCDFAVRTSHVISEDFKLKVHAARHKDEEVLSRSQSGGAFSALSSVVLDDGGVVYGAAFNDDFTVSHRRAATYEERDAMRGSKYVQSDMSGVFALVKKDLEDGRTVMFTGTPCQVAGLKSSLPERLHDGLLAVDFVCHGVPSPAVWNEYVKFRSDGKKILAASFRDKEACGWKTCRESFTDEHGRKQVYDTYADLFSRNIMLRESCYGCPYNVLSRESDVSLADFWGSDQACPDFGGDVGTSMLVCRTRKGERLFEAAKCRMRTEDVEIDYAFMERFNPDLIAPSHHRSDINGFRNVFVRKGILAAARRYGNLGWRYKAWKLKVFVKKMFGIG